MYNTKFILSNGTEIYPGYLSPEKKNDLKEYYKNQRGFMRCGCKPDANLFYRISEDLRIYPEHNNYQHDIFCCRYKDHSGDNSRQIAYIINEESGDVVAFTSFDPLTFSQDVDSYREQNNAVPEDGNENIEEITIDKNDSVSNSSTTRKEPKLSLAGLIRSINVDSFTEKAINNHQIESREKFSTLVYYRMKKIRLARTKKYIGELSLEKDGCRFMYLPFAGIMQKEDKGFKKCYLQTTGVDGKLYSNFVFPDIMRKAAQEFTKTYGIRPNKHTMVAGFQYLKKTKSGSSYKLMGRIHLFQTSDIGIYCRSMAEVETFNYLQTLSETNTDIRYWIPPEDENIGAIVEVKGKPKKILLLFPNKKEEHVAYDRTMYEPLVVANDSDVTEEILYKLADATQEDFFEIEDEGDEK